MKLIAEDYHKKVRRALQLRKLKMLEIYRRTVQEFDSATEQEGELPVPAHVLAERLPQISGNKAVVHVEIR